MKKQLFPWIISVAALGVALSAHWRPQEPGAGSGQTPQASSAAPERAEAVPSRATPVRRPANPLPSRVADAETLAEMSGLLADVQARLVAMETRMQEMRPGWENLAMRGMVRLSEQELAEVRQRALNLANDEQERLRAFNLLRRQNAIDDAAATAMVQLASAATDPEVREELYRRMEGLTNAVLKGPLLAAMQSEQNAEVREEIVEAMGRSMATDPDVEAWLRHLAANDESERVRREARESLNERFRHMPVESVQNLVMQPDVPAEEKLAAMEQLRREDARTTEVVMSMIDLYAGTDDARVRAEVFDRLEGVSDPVLRDPLLLGLSEDPNARVRREAADSLAAYATDPDVKAWLEYAAANDEDPGVRRQASQSLNGGGNDEGRRRWGRRRD